MTTFKEYSDEISHWSEKLINLANIRLSYERHINELRYARQRVCEHKNTFVRPGHDSGGGMEGIRPSYWYTRDCEDCGAVLAVRGDRMEDEWRELPLGSKHCPYGVATPDGSVYNR